MAKLPGYDSKVAMTTEPGSVKRDISQEQQFGKDISTMGKAASDIAKVWQDAKDFEETLDRQNYLDRKTQELMIRAQEEPDYKNDGRYTDDLAKLKEESLTGFSNNLARDKFSVNVQNQTAQTQIKLDSMFRTKMVKKVQGDLIESHEHHKTEYVKTGDAMEMAMQQALVNSARYRGIVDPVFVANEHIKIQDWKNLRYLQMAQQGQVKEALEMIDESDMQPSEKNAAKGAIMTMAQQGAIIAQVNRINNEQKMYAEADAFIDDPQKSFVDKLSYLDQQRKFGLPQSDYNELLGALTSKHSVAAESHSAAKAEIVLAIKRMNNSIGDTGKKKKSFGDITDYLKELKATRKLITQKQAEGVITKDDKIGFLSDLKTTTAEERSISAASMRKQKLAWWFADYAVYGYDDAYKDIQDNLELKSASDDAFLEVYYADQDNKMTSKERKLKVTEVIDKYNERLAAEIMDEMRAETGLAPKKVETEAAMMKRLEVSEQDILDTMAAENWTRDYTVNYLRKQ